jgi:hypothetical protein
VPTSHFPTFGHIKLKANRRKPESVQVGNVVVKIYRREKLHKVKDETGKVSKKFYRILRGCRLHHKHPVNALVQRSRRAIKRANKITPAAMRN